MTAYVHAYIWGRAYRHVVGSLHLRILGERRACASARAGRGRARGRTRARSRAAGRSSGLDDPLLNCVRVAPSRSFLAEVPGTVPAHTVSIVGWHCVFTAAVDVGSKPSSNRRPANRRDVHTQYHVNMYTWICMHIMNASHHPTRLCGHDRTPQACKHRPWRTRRRKSKMDGCSTRS